MNETECRDLLEGIIRNSTLIVESYAWGSQVRDLAETIDSLARHLLSHHFITR